MINPEYSFFELAKSGVFFCLYDCVKYFPFPLGGLLRFLVLKVFCRRIRTLWIKDGATFWFPDKISIGRNTSINEYVVINGAAGVEIGDDVLIGHRTSIVSDTHGFEGLDTKIYLQPKPKLPVKIGNNIFIGCNVTILPGVRVADGAVIGAGSVVTRDVPENAVVAGNPARVLRLRGAKKG